jgi:hypothetical protein
LRNFALGFARGHERSSSNKLSVFGPGENPTEWKNILNEMRWPRKRRGFRVTALGITVRLKEHYWWITKGTKAEARRYAPKNRNAASRGCEAARFQWV